VLGGEGKGGGGGQLSVAWGQGKERRGGQGSATWASTAQTRWLRAAPTAADGARLTGDAGLVVAREDSGARRRGHERLTDGAR
jgi:hypothetical protein